MYCVICGKHRKFKNPKIYIFEKALGLSIIYSKCENENEKISKKKNQLKYSWFN